MSRHAVPAIKPGQTAFVGWDPPLMSFFGQVYQGGRLLKWVGAWTWGELPEVEDLVRALQGRVHLDAATLARLRADRAADHA